MNRNSIRATACCITATVVLSSSSFVSHAAVTAGAGSFVSAAVEAEGTSSADESVNAGISRTLAQSLSKNQEAAAVDNAIQKVQNETPIVKSEYDDIAIAQVDNFVNVRSTASEDGEVVGKLYNNSAATVLATEGDWYKIHSGDVEGYIKAEFLVLGDENLAKSVGHRVAEVTGDGLYVRAEASTESGVLGQVPTGEELTVVEEKDDWVKVSIEEGDGYVKAEFVNCATHYITAESKEAEEARLKKEEEERKAAEEAARKATQKSSNSSSKSGSGSSSSNSGGSSQSYAAPSGGNGQAVAGYAAQFVGNPYVYGGTSLTSGADCSGFVMSVYAAFGIGLPHSSSALRSVGYEVGQDAMQPGDIVCYSGHVAIYVGNNTIVHASTEATGIKYTSPANYRSIITVRRIF